MAARGDTSGVVAGSTGPPTTEPPPFADIGSASTGYITLCSALVFLMMPGLAFFYSGLSKHNNALSLIMLCMMTMSIVTVQFFLFGYSLSFSETGGLFIGDFSVGGLGTVGMKSFANTAPQIPGISFVVYQMQFATISAALIFGSVPERTRFLPAMVFVFLWTTLVYDFSAYWSWADHGWIRNFACLREMSKGGEPCFKGGYDFAGGGPVHIASGFSGLAYCLMIGKRKHMHVEHHSLVNVCLGVGLLWTGWFGFNGGSAGASNARAAMATTVTTISAAAGSLTWTWFDYIFTRKFSALSYCSGAVAGLVGITPAAGFVAPWAGFVIGVVTSLFCNGWCRLKKRIGFDDSFDAWSVHGSGGFIGSLLTAIFAQKWIGRLDGTEIDGGWMEGNWMQMVYQLVGSAVIAAWSFVVTVIILFVLNRIPGLHIRQSEEEESNGGDFAEMGEVGYMLVISEPGAGEPRHFGAEPLGVLMDGRRVSVANLSVHLNTLTREDSYRDRDKKPTSFLNNREIELKQMPVRSVSPKSKNHRH